MSTIDSKYLKKIVAGGKSYVPSKITKELKQAGFKSSLYGKVTQEQAARVVRHLQSKGLLSKSKNATQLYQEATKTQTADQEAIRLAKAQKHIQANIRIDLDQEIAAEERGQQSINYDPRSVLGQNLAQRIQQEQQNREEKIQDRATQKNKMS